MSSADVQGYDRDLKKHQLAFTTAHRTLSDRLGLEATVEVLDHAETWGLEETRRWLAGHAKRFAIGSAAALEEVWGVVIRCYDAMADMDATLARRESILRRADSARELRLIHHGREFKVDLTAKRVTYLDDGSSAPMTLEPLEPPGARDKTRSRTRDRER